MAKYSSAAMRNFCEYDTNSEYLWKWIEAGLQQESECSALLEMVVCYVRDYLTLCDLEGKILQFNLVSFSPA